MAEGNAFAPSVVDNSGTIKKYAELKGAILDCIDAMSAIEYTHAHESMYDELKEKIRTDSFNLVVVGQFKRGKTCLINSLLGAEILPVAVVPLTSIVTILTFGETLTVKVFFNDGRIVEVQPGQLAEYVTETKNPKNEKDVREVLITYPSSYLKDGVRLIDTPGVGSVYLHNTDVAYQYLPRSDAALFLLSVEQPASKAELDFLRDVKQYSDRIFFLLNKIDYLSETETTESIAFSGQVIKEAMGSEVKIFPVSAKLALEGQLKVSDELMHKSRLPAFSTVLNRFLLHEKGKVLLLSATSHLMRILSQSRLETELELKSLTAPLEELEEKIQAFERKKEDILLEKQSFDILLDGELNRLIKSGLDEDLAASREQFAAEMEKRFDSHYEENKELPLKELGEKLEAFVIEEVERAFTEWRGAQDEKLAGAFQTVCDKFAVKINETVDALLKFSSQLFAIPFETSSVESLWMSESCFYFKMKQEQVGLDMLATSLTHVLPRLVHSRFKRLKAYLFRMAYRRIHDKQKEQMLELIDMQAGRIRYDFVERLNKSKLEFRRQMLQKLEATVEGIAGAIEKGMRQRARGKEEVEARRTVLFGGLQRIDEIRNEVLSIRERAGKM